jgi:tetratricopeptide (TPR) repeat protein
MVRHFVLPLFLFAFACAEKSTLVVKDSPPLERPPGLIVASEKAEENGKKHLRKGHCKQAIHEFNKALEKNPNNFSALYWLGVAEGMCGYYDRAYDRFVLALKYSPDRNWQARVYATIGITLLYMNREEEAVAYFERARAIDPRNELVVSYYDVEEHGRGKGHKKHKFKKKPKDREGFEITLRWLD